MFITIKLEDLFLHGQLDGETQLWTIFLSDGFTGKTERVHWTMEELSAVLALGVGSVGEENVPGYDVSKLYEVAEKACKDLPKELRPIP